MKKLIFLFGIIFSLAACNNQIDETFNYSDSKAAAANEEIHFNIMVIPSYTQPIGGELKFNVYLESWSGVKEAPYDILISMDFYDSRNSVISITGKNIPGNPDTYVYEPLYIKKGDKFDNLSGYYGLTISDIIPVAGLEQGDFIYLKDFTVNLFDENGEVDLFGIGTNNYDIVWLNWYTGNIRWGLYMDGQKYYLR